MHPTCSGNENLIRIRDFQTIAEVRFPSSEQLLVDRVPVNLPRQTPPDLSTSSSDPRTHTSYRLLACYYSWSPGIVLICASHHTKQYTDWLWDIRVAPLARGTFCAEAAEWNPRSFFRNDLTMILVHRSTFLVQTWACEEWENFVRHYQRRA